jgi:hypothetical protein
VEQQPQQSIQQPNPTSEGRFLPGQRRGANHTQRRNPISFRSLAPSQPMVFNGPSTSLRRMPGMSRALLRVGLPLSSDTYWKGVSADIRGIRRRLEGAVGLLVRLDLDFNRNRGRKTTNVGKWFELARRDAGNSSLIAVARRGFRLCGMTLSLSPPDNYLAPRCGWSVAGLALPIMVRRRLR